VQFAINDTKLLVADDIVNIKSFVRHDAEFWILRQNTKITLEITGVKGLAYITKLIRKYARIVIKYFPEV
jgi:hypothetical protein